MTLGERAALYTRATVSPGSLLSDALSAGLDQWRNAPPEWRDGFGGYGRRFGYGLVGSVTSNTIEFGVSALRHEDTRYVRSKEKGFLRRAAYVIVHTYIVPRDDGQTTFAASRLIGAYGGAAASVGWEPARLNNAGDVLLRGTWSLAGDMGNSAFLEFWPDIKRKLFGKR